MGKKRLIARALAGLTVGAVLFVGTGVGSASAVDGKDCQTIVKGDSKTYSCK